MTKFQGCLILVLCSIVGRGMVCAQQQSSFSFKNIHLEQITDEDGLSNGFVTSIIQDRKGFIWFGTANGLNRYDGYQFKTWMPEEGNPNSLSQGTIWALYESKDGTIWIGTGKGLNRFDPAKDTFTRYLHDPNNKYSLSNNVINAIVEDGRGNLWVGTANGLNILQQGSNQFSRFFFEPNSPEKREVRSIARDEHDCMWFGSMDTLFCFDPVDKIFHSFACNMFDQSVKRSNNYLKTIYLADSLHIWISTDFNGIYLFDKKKYQFERQFKHKASNKNTLCHDCISSFLKDDSGNLWIGSYNGGWDVLESNRKTFHHFEPDPFNPIHQNFEIVRSILLDRSDNIWLGTFYGGAKVVMKNRKPFINYVAVPGKPGSLLGNKINVLTDRTDGKIWITIHSAGIASFDPAAEVFSAFTPQIKPEESHGAINILSVLEEKNGNLWAISLNEIWKMDSQTRQWKDLKPYGMPGTSSWLLSQFIDSQGTHWIGTQNGLFIYDQNANTMKPHPLETERTGIEHGANNYIEHFYECPNGDLLIATHGGLNRRLAGSWRFEFYPFHLQVFCTHQDKKGTIWLSTSGGLAYLNPKNQKVAFHPKAKSMYGKLVNAILEDGLGRLWIGTETSIICFDPVSGASREYNHKDGLINRQFPGAHLKSKTEEFYFGGTKGMLRFNPSSIKDNEFIPPIVLTNFQILNKNVPLRGAPGDTLRWKSPLDTNITYISRVFLKHWQNDFAFEFAALDFTAPLNNRYKIMLEGYDTTWVETNAERRFAHYTNISPGTYAFKVIGSNSDGKWNEAGTSVIIIIDPPWWATWWAYILYALTAFGLLFVIRRYELNRQLIKSEALRLEELDAAKTQLYTNITHEFRTPLTIILGLAEQLKAQASEGVKSGLDMIRRNGLKLLKSVNQMLDLAKAESGQLKLALVQGDIINYLRYLFESFHSLAEVRKIRLHFQSDRKELIMDYDPERLQSVVSNLLSNAIKFTLEGGDVSLLVRQITENHAPILELKVVDTGSGIPEDKLPFIFDRFYQADDSVTRSSEGTGIGLTLARELVKLMKGNITAANNPEKGAAFTVLLPITHTTSFSKDSQRLDVAEMFSGIFAPTKSILKPPAFSQAESKGKPFVLLIEDNPDVVHYLRLCLQNKYRIVEAFNGITGKDKALELVPDLIISDVMMPQMDGFDVCHTLKTDSRTSHIPIILLTAKADIDSRLTGLRRGADDYLAKPFHKEELLTRISNLLELRRQLQAHYLQLAGKNTVGQSGATALSLRGETMEDAFIQSVKSLIETDFSKQWQAPELAQSLHISESQLYRKLQALTGMHITEFTRYIRLLKASRLLVEQPDEKISTIAYDVGFMNAQEFSRRFKEVFGTAPSDWRSNKDNFD